MSSDWLNTAVSQPVRDRLDHPPVVPDMERGSGPQGPVRRGPMVRYQPRSGVSTSPTMSPAVPGDPSANNTALERISFVVAGGA